MLPSLRSTCLRLSSSIGFSSSGASSSRALSTSPARFVPEASPFAPFPRQAAARRAFRPQGEGGEAQFGSTLRQIEKGDILTPRDLSLPGRKPLPTPRRPRAILGPASPVAHQIDPFHRLSIDPLREYRNSRLLSSFLSEVGRIKGRAETGLTKGKQARVGKAVRRARAMGLLPRWQASDPFMSPEARKVLAVKEGRQRGVQGGGGGGASLMATLIAGGRPGGLAAGGYDVLTGESVEEVDDGLDLVDDGSVLDRVGVSSPPSPVERAKAEGRPYEEREAVKGVDFGEVAREQGAGGGDGRVGLKPRL